MSAYWMVNKAGMSGVAKDVKGIFEELCVNSGEATTATTSFLMLSALAVILTCTLRLQVHFLLT